MTRIYGAMFQRPAAFCYCSARESLFKNSTHTKTLCVMSHTFLRVVLPYYVPGESQKSHTKIWGDGTDCFTVLAQPLWGRSKLLTPKVRTTVTARPFDRAKASTAHLPRKGQNCIYRHLPKNSTVGRHSPPWKKPSFFH